MSLVDFISGITQWFSRFLSIITWEYNGESISLLYWILGYYLFIIVVSVLPRGGTD